MGLPDLLQWAAATGVQGVVTIERRPQPVWLALRDREVVAASAAPLGRVPIDQVEGVALEARGGVGSHAQVDAGSLALEHLYDQFIDDDDRFAFHERDVPPGGVELEVSIQLLVMEGLRHVDEWPDIRKLYHSDQAHIALANHVATAGLSPVQTALLSLAERGAVSLSDARLSLGLSRPALLRNVEALRRLGAVTVAGCPSGGDLITHLLNQATLLLKEQQFDEAAHVFSALLSADPGAPRIKALLREAEQEQTRLLYRKLPASAVVRIAGSPEAGHALSGSDRVVLELVNGRWDVSTLVLASPLREVETLKALVRLTRCGITRLQLSDAARDPR